MLWKISRKIEIPLRSLYKRLSEPPIPNLIGDRDIEYSWICSRIPQGSGRALDFGSGPYWMGLLAARKGYNVTAVDLTSVDWPYRYPSLVFHQRNIFAMDFAKETFSLILNCSAIEHVGLTGRYNTELSDRDGDIKAMKLLHEFAAPRGIMLMTIPVGIDSVFAPLHRVYGNERLPLLLEGWRVNEEEYWTKDSTNKWVVNSKREALQWKPTPHCYALGLFSLEKV
jgi:SAM-dependent methyltransferase